MTDPIEAAARAIHNARIAGGKNYWDWDTAGLEDAQPGYTASVYQDARAAIDAYHAAQPSDYGDLKNRLMLHTATIELRAEAKAAIENLEDERDKLRARVAELEDAFKHAHVGCPGFKVATGVYSGCDQSAGDCPICGQLT